MSCLINRKYQDFQVQVCRIGVLIVKILFLCRKWVLMHILSVLFLLGSAEADDG